MKTEFNTNTDSPTDGLLVDAALFGGFGEDTFTLSGIVVASRRNTGLNKIDAKGQLTEGSLGIGNSSSDVVCDFGFGDVDRVRFS